jgi:hypothetical protein
VVVLRGFAPRIIWKQVGLVDGLAGDKDTLPPPKVVRNSEEFGGSADRRR